MEREGEGGRGGSWAGRHRERRWLQHMVRRREAERDGARANLVARLTTRVPVQELTTSRFASHDFDFVAMLRGADEQNGEEDLDRGEGHEDEQDVAIDEDDDEDDDNDDEDDDDDDEDDEDEDEDEEMMEEDDMDDDDAELDEGDDLRPGQRQMRGMQDREIRNRPKSNAGKKLKYSMRRWNALLDAACLPKEVINELLMEFFLCEGFVKAAEAFQGESATKPNSFVLEEVHRRNRIRQAVLNENIELAIDQINSVSPEILENDIDLLFRLRKHILIKLIQESKIKTAIEYAQTSLAPLVTNEHPSLKEELQRVLSLLIFEDIEKSPLAHMLSNEELKDSARRVNAAILKHNKQESEARLLHLLREAQWAQNYLSKSDNKVEFPEILRLNRRDEIKLPMVPPKPLP